MKLISAFSKMFFKTCLIVLIGMFIVGYRPSLAKQTPTETNSIYLPLISRPYAKSPAPGLKLAYSSQYTGQLMQYSVDSGTLTELLPDHMMYEDCWKFSPDKTYPKLLYLLDNPATGDLEVKVKDLFGANTVVAFPNAYRNSCSNFWHPSGSVVAAYNVETEVYDLLYPTGVKLTSFWGDLGWKASFSPDGNRVVFVSPFRSNVLRFFDIIKDVQGNVIGLAQSPSDFVVVETGDRFIADVDWSPDGSKLAIIVKNTWNLRDGDILLIEPSGTVLANLTNGFSLMNGKQQSYWGLRWSPTEQKLAFWVYNLEGNVYVNPQVFMINLTSGKIIELTGGVYPVGETPSFAPDGKKLIFTAGPQFGRTIVMCNPDGTDKVALPIENSAFNATFRP